MNGTCRIPVLMCGACGTACLTGREIVQHYSDHPDHAWQDRSTSKVPADGAWKQVGR